MDYRERNVNQAAKSVVNYYREANPKLLNKKHRGRFTKDQEEQVFVQNTLKDGIDGADLLAHNGENPIYMDRMLTDEDFKKIKYLQRKKREEEEEER